MVESKPFMVLEEMHMGSEEKVKTELEFLKPVVKREFNKDQCGTYVLSSPLEGDQTVLTFLGTCDNREYTLKDHRASEVFRNLKKSGTESDKTTTILSPQGGFIERDRNVDILPPLPNHNIPVLSDQFFRITRLKTRYWKARTQALSVVLSYAVFVYAYEEEGALSFVVAEDEDGEEEEEETDGCCSIVVFERYVSEAFFREVHARRESFEWLAMELKKVAVEQSTQEYRAVRGFVSKKEKLL